MTKLVDRHYGLTDIKTGKKEKRKIPERKRRAATEQTAETQTIKRAINQTRLDRRWQ